MSYLAIVRCSAVCCGCMTDSRFSLQTGGGSRVWRAEGRRAAGPTRLAMVGSSILPIIITPKCTQQAGLVVKAILLDVVPLLPSEEDLGAMRCTLCNTH